MAPVDELIEILLLLTENVISLPSASEAVTVPMAIWFSSTVKVASEVKLGALSFMLVIVTVMSCVAELVPSLAVTVAV